MDERADPGRTGVKAGRVVGVLTAALLVVSLLRVQGDFVGRIESLVALLPFDPGPSVSVYFYLYLVSAAVARYGLCYVVGSLIGVVYDWLDRPSVAVVAGFALAAGLVDGVAAGIDTRSTGIAVGYVLSWLVFVPAFLYFAGGEDGGYHDEPRRFDES
jgi:tetrahydromethanopterin S-methyltransferase subunit F